MIGLVKPKEIYIMRKEGMVNSVDKLKRSLRLTALESRCRIWPAQKCLWEKQVCRFLTDMPEVQSATRIFTYAGTGAELSLECFHHWAGKVGKALAFPVSRPGGVMDAYIPTGPDDMKTGLFGIPEPDVRTASYLSPEEIDVVLVPCVAYDGEGNRLGHGGGYYDRYLPRCTQAMKILIAFVAQRLDRVPKTELDVPVDAIVTEEGIFRLT